jgi:hypothetical protein
MVEAKKKQKPQQWPAGMEEEAYIRRAVAAYLRSGHNGELPPQPSWDSSTVEEHQGSFYVVLRNVNGVLAVYRLRRQGILKRLKRWPQELEGAKRKGRR